MRQARLSRSDAATLIEKSSELGAFKTKIPVRDKSFERLGEQGLGEVGPNGTLSGRIAEESSSLEHQFTGTRYLVLKGPGSITVAATGIADQGESSKSVEFTWKYVDLPKYARRFAVEGGTG